MYEPHFIFWVHSFSPLMIINDLDIEGIAILETET